MSAAAVLTAREGGESSCWTSGVAKGRLAVQSSTMPTRPSREDDFIGPFLSAYEDGNWADSEATKPDAIDRINPAVDKLATRKSDGRTLAIEHTIIEPFIGDKEDFAFF